MPRRTHTAELVARLADERGRRVAFVSHCLLNENTRYLGGAFRAGGVAELIDALIAEGVGLVQMPCPEQHAWGGVLKRHMLRAYGSRGSLVYRLRRPLLWLFLLYTRAVFGRLARGVAAEIADYQRSGCTVVAIVGVSASPSCGVNTTLDIRRSFEAMARIPAHALDRRRVNRDVVLGCQQAGAGIFIRSLQRQLRRRGVAVPLLEHDLIAEMHGQPQRLLDDYRATPTAGAPRRSARPRPPR